MKVRFGTLLALAAATLVSSAVSATTITLNATPSMVPDETQPRINPADYPSGFGTDSWQGPPAGVNNKTNFHVRYNGDGNYMNTEFPAEAATFTINDIDEISYSTKRPAGTPAGRDWWIQIYTRPTGSGDCGGGGWYHRRYINNYGSHTNIGSWTQYSSSTGMTFQEQNCSGTLVGSPMTLAQLKAATGGSLVLMFSVQTDSGWGGFDGFMDGLYVRHMDGSVGRTNFGSMFLPASSKWSLAALGLVLAGALTFFFVRRQSA
jgi:hypothetical protein